MKYFYQFIFLLCFTSISVATIHTVPRDYQSIQDAVNISWPGDTVLVYPGTYYENVLLHTNRITLASEYLFSRNYDDIRNTAIDANDFMSPLQISSVNGQVNIIGLTLLHASNSGIDIDTSDVLLSRLRIKENNSPRGGGINIRQSDVHIDNCSVYKNSSNQSGASGISISSSTVTIDNSRIHHNEGFCDGGGIGINTSSVYINNTVIHNNHPIIWGGGIVAIGGSFLRLDRVLVAQNNCIKGGGLYVDDCTVELINCTICDNVANDECGSIYFDDCSPVVLNTIIYNNYPVGLYDGMTANYSLIEDGYEGEAILDTLPGFVNPYDMNYQLLSTSPCIDAGTDFYVVNGDTVVDIPEADFIGASPDLGMYEFIYVGVEDTGAVFLPGSIVLVDAFPNPFNSGQTIRVTLRESSPVRLSVFDLLGREISVLTDKRFSPGVHQFTLDAVSWPGGTYFLRTQTKHQDKTTKIILLK